MTRREYAGAAAPSYITSTLGGTSSDVTIYCNNLTNWPDGTIGPFFVVIDRGTANEEKILCSSRTGNTLTVVASTGRGSDDTTISAHSSGAVIEHVFTATDADEANYHVNTAASTSTVAIHGLQDGSSVVGTTDTQTLENKTIDGADNTLVVPQSQVTNLTADLALKAPLASPALTGNPTAPTPSTADNDTSIATTAYVKAQNVTGFHGIKTGSVAITVPVGDTFALSAVTFSGTPFSSAPIVSVTSTGGNGANTGAGYNAYASAITTTGMNVGVRNTANSTFGTSITITVHWIAIGAGA